MSFTGSVWDGSSSPVLSRVYSAHSFLNNNKPHPASPFTLFAIIHAVRIACAYRGVARAGGWDHRIGLFQAFTVPLVLILGGTTITSILMGAVPGWLISPIPVATYGLIPLIASESGLVSFLLSTPRLPRDLLFSTVDGFSRVVGMTTLGVDTVLAHPNPALRNSPWAMVLVATIAGGGGGMLIPAMKMFHADWGFDATPAWVRDGPGVDIWGATVIGYVYALVFLQAEHVEKPLTALVFALHDHSTLIDAHPFFRLLPKYLLTIFPFGSNWFHLPKSYYVNPSPVPLLPNHEAKIFCSVLLSLMLCTRTLWPYLQSNRKLTASSLNKKNKKVTPTSALTSSKAMAAVADKPSSSSSAVSVDEKNKQGLKERKTK
ncbi:BQ5605_C010g06022 [Microbotryum silenes-dioicae]|uniref:BQ5605_C010g06022 protein n=1 Tax=Microbotryum silenes-dioicae TaxID=796604 RepID=A0A2X0MBF9_9BASI|nr:BQ5605_C010g06022 [Microbotryum silenes-dioicae]